MGMKTKKHTILKNKKRNRIKSSLKNDSYPRLVVYRSNKNIFAQIIDDINSKTIVSASSIDKDILKDIEGSKSKLDKGIVVGKKIGTLARKEKVNRVVFDRNGYRYHGRIKALADAVRETGIKF